MSERAQVARTDGYETTPAKALRLKRRPLALALSAFSLLGLGLLPACGGGTPAPGSGGSASGGGSGVGGSGVGGNTGTGGAITGSANFTVNASLSSAIATVGIVEWSVDVAIQSAVIEFGRAGAVEFTAPVDLTAPSYRTLLLGMKQGETYTIRVVAEGGGQTYASTPVELEAGYISNSLPSIELNESIPGASYGGLTVSCNGVGGALPGEDSPESWAFVFDADGDYVWGYDLGPTPVAGCSRARMSHDGKHMWVGTFSNATGGTPSGALMRVSMDGLERTDYTTQPSGGTNLNVPNIDLRHHDFTVLPSGNILYQERKGPEDSNPDRIMELDPATGTPTLIYDEETDFASLGEWHTNYVSYIPDLNAFSFSMRHNNTIVLASYPSAQILGIFNGDMDEFELDWTAQHGHQFIDGSLLVFNNTNGGPANMLEFTYDLTGDKTAGPVDTYTGGPVSIAFGDVQRLPNGNTFITYSNSGTIHELDPSGALVRTFETESLGYAEHRPDLYGPPPHLE